MASSRALPRCARFHGPPRPDHTHGVILRPAVRLLCTLVCFKLGCFASRATRIASSRSRSMQRTALCRAQLPRKPHRYDCVHLAAIDDCAARFGCKWCFIRCRMRVGACCCSRLCWRWRVCCGSCGGARDWLVWAGNSSSNTSWSESAESESDPEGSIRSVETFISTTEASVCHQHQCMLCACPSQMASMRDTYRSSYSACTIGAPSACVRWSCWHGLTSSLPTSTRIPVGGAPVLRSAGRNGWHGAVRGAKCRPSEFKVGQRWAWR